jgi:peptidoglycan/xylan/chitin deacetylase (PgdA/CDA1 family)
MSRMRTMRWVIDHVARACGVLAWFERRMRGVPTVLTYHRVLPDVQCARYPFPSLVMPLSMFEQQVAWLAARAEVRPLRELHACLATRGSGSGRALVAVTFDDGYHDNAELAAPVLERFGVRGTFFVTTGFVGDGAAMWYDRAATAVGALGDDAVRVAIGRTVAVPSPAQLAADRVGAWVETLKACGPAERRAAVEALARAAGAAAGDVDGSFRAMRPADVGRLADAGHEIGSHSHSHEILTSLEDDELERELALSRRRIEQWTGRPVAGFCYPNGSVDDRVAAATARAGYAYACTTSPPSRRAAHADRHRLPRVDVTRRRVVGRGDSFDLTAFRAEISSLHEVMR